MNIPSPVGFEPPPNAEIGGDFDAVATFTINEDGTLTLKAIDGAPVEHSAPKKKHEAMEGEMEDDSMMNRAMKQFGPPKY